MRGATSMSKTNSTVINPDELVFGFIEAKKEDKRNITKEGIRRKFEDGTSKFANRRCYGYRQNKNGRLRVDKKEAAVVRMIFELSAQGYSLNKIAAKLHEDGVPSPTGKEKWHPDSIRKLLANEKYIGQVDLQKTVTIHGKQVKNEDLAQKHSMTNHHPPIIPKELFRKVNR